MTFTYFPTIPNPPDDPGDDVASMQTNSGSIGSIIAVDHVGFNVSGGGLHKQVTFSLNQAAPGFGAGVSDMYANIFNGQSWPFWQNALGSAFQMLGPIDGNNANGGILIPGGILLKFGFVNSTTNGTVTFNTPFPNSCFNVWTNAYFIGANPNGAAGIAIKNTVADLTASSFKWVFNTNSGAYSGFFWAAIGN
jgi:hypothetical protein